MTKGFGAVFTVLRAKDVDGVMCVFRASGAVCSGRTGICAPPYVRIARRVESCLSDDVGSMSAPHRGRTQTALNEHPYGPGPAQTDG